MGGDILFENEVLRVREAVWRPVACFDYAGVMNQPEIARDGIAGRLTSQLTIWITEVHEADPHSGHELRHSQILGSFRTTHWIWVTVLRIAIALGVVKYEGDFLKVHSAIDVGNAVDLEQLD